MSLANRKNIGVTYVATTSVLLVAIVGSWQCWQSLNVGNHPSETLHDICLAIWVVSGVLLALSQIVFIGIALGIKDSGVSNTDVAAGASPGEAHASVPKTLMLVGGLVILAVIAVFLFALFNMPS
jgi:hypothetical protein